MKVISFSDTHGLLPKINGEFDLMLLAGDISGSGGFEDKKKWWLTVFNDWFKNLSLKDTCRILITPGNHDNAHLLSSSKFMNEFHNKYGDFVKFLIDEEYVFTVDEAANKYLRIYGTPWCKQYGKWSFMDSDEKLTEKYASIPEGIDILLTHDAPYGCSDICYDHKWSNGEHLGNIPLREAILKKKPRFCLHGHLHTANHDQMFLEGTCVINVAVCNEEYELEFDPLVLTDQILDYEFDPTLNDDEIVFPNRSKSLIRLRKTGVDWTLETKNSYYTRVGYDNDKNIKYIDPDGGPLISVGSQWFGYEIKSIKELENELIFELKKCSE